MLRAYLNYFGVLKRLAICSFLFRRFRDKTTQYRYIKGSKDRNKLQEKYLESKNEEANYHSQISSLKWNKKSTCDAFTDGKNSKNTDKIYFKISRHQKRRGWCFCKQAKIENGNSDKVWRKGPTNTVCLMRLQVQLTCCYI